MDVALPSFLKISNNQLQFRHPSAKEFVLKEMAGEGEWMSHLKMAKACLGVLERTLCRKQQTKELRGDGHSAPGSYTTVFWIKHLTELDRLYEEELVSATRILEKYWMQWLEVLDTKGLLQNAIDMMVTFHETFTAKVIIPPMLVISGHWYGPIYQ